MESLVHQRVNDVRVENGLAPLASDPTIASVSRAHSEDMADLEYFSHVNPDGEGPWDRYRQVAESPCSVYGENIAMVHVGPGDTAEEVAARIVGLWMDSTGHRRNILSSAWSEEGVGVYITADGTVYVTHDFCG